MGAFADAVKAAVDDFKARAQAMPAAIVDEAAERLIARTPKGDPSIWKSKPPADYVPGNLKSNWRLGVDAIDTTTITDTNSFTLQGRSAMPAEGLGHVYYLSNALPYAWTIERDRHSSQAPQGMVRLTGVEFDEIVRAAAVKVRAMPKRSSGPREL